MTAALSLLLLAPGHGRADSAQVSAETARHDRPASADPNTALALGANPIALTTVITLTDAGFTPAAVAVTAGTQVTWYNATSRTEFLTSSVPHQLFLPAIQIGSRGAAAASSRGTREAVTAPAVAPDRFGGVLPAGGTLTHTFNLMGNYTYYVLNAPLKRGQVSAVPADPGTMASTIDPSVATDLCSATQFIYSGTVPIQTGVAPGTIACAHVAVLRGKVLTRDGSPLPGVTISILNHPEFGQTLSRADGAFDLAVNGGQQLTVVYARSDFLAAQRQLSVPWQDYQWLPDVILTAIDPSVSLIDLTASIPIQVARGSLVSDTNGQRRATLFFPQGVTATLVFSDGSRLPVTQLHVRATEFSVGATGPNAMPATLPPASGYMFAEVFTADEANMAGAQNVVFSRPLIEYVENYLGFTVGVTVPVGTYDPRLAVWSDSGDGRVVKILSLSGGKAVLDVDGSGQPAGPAALAALGITDAERQELATLYGPGQTLMRVPIPHFDQPYDT